MEDKKHRVTSKKVKVIIKDEIIMRMNSKLSPLLGTHKALGKR